MFECALYSVDIVSFRFGHLPLFAVPYQNYAIL